MCAEKNTKNKEIQVPKTFEDAISQIALLSETARARENEVSTLKKEALEIRSEAAELRAQVSNLEELVRLAQQSQERNEAEIEKAGKQKSHEHEKRRLHLLKERELKKALIEKDKRISLLEEEIGELKNQWPEEASQEIPALFSEEIERVKLENDELNRSSAELKSEIAVRDAKILKLEEKNKSLEDDVSILKDAAPKIESLAIDSETKKFIEEELETILFKIDDMTENMLDEDSEKSEGSADETKAVEPEVKDKFKKLLKIIARDEILALLSRCEAETRHLQNELEGLTESFRESSEENTKLAADLKKISEKNEKLFESERALAEENTNLTRALKEKTLEAERLFSSSQSLSEEIEAHRKTKNLTLEEKTAEIKRLSEKCRELADENSSFSRQLSEIRKAKDEIESKFSALSLEHADFPALLQSKIKNIEQLESEAAELRVENSKLLSKVSECNSEIANLATQHEELHSARNALEKLLEEKNSEIARFRTTSSQSETAAAELEEKKAAVEKLSESIKKLESESDALKNEVENLKEINKNLLGTNLGISGELEASKKKIKDYESNISSKETEIQRLMEFNEREMEKLRVSLKEAEGRFSANDETLAASLEKEAAAEERMKVLAESIENIQIENEGFKERILTLESENDSLRDATAELEKKYLSAVDAGARPASQPGNAAEVEKMRETIRVLENQYNGALSEISNMRSNLDGLSSSLNEIMSDLAASTFVEREALSADGNETRKVSPDVLFVLDDPGDDPRSGIPEKILSVLKNLGLAHRKISFRDHLFGGSGVSHLAVFLPFESTKDAPRLFEAAESALGAPVILFSSASNIGVCDCVNIIVSGAFADFVDLSASEKLVEAAITRALERRITSMGNVALHKDSDECKLRESVVLTIDNRSKSNRIEDIEKRVTFLKENNKHMKDNLRSIQNAFDHIVSVIAGLDLASIPNEIAEGFNEITSTLLKIASIK